MITQRQLRNQSAAVMDAVEHGQTIVVTRNGTPVAELRPVGRRTFLPTAELRRSLATCLPTDYTAMCAEMDALFGEGRLDVCIAAQRFAPAPSQQSPRDAPATPGSGRSKVDEQFVGVPGFHARDVPGRQAGQHPAGA
jgi:prevent-host-death family protein